MHNYSRVFFSYTYEETFTSNHSNVYVWQPLVIRSTVGGGMEEEERTGSVNCGGGKLSLS